MGRVTVTHRLPLWSKPFANVFPRLAVRQWVLSVPKRLRYFLQRDGAALNTALRIFLRVIQGSLHQHCAGRCAMGVRQCLVADRA